MLLNHRPSHQHLALIASGIVLGWLGYHGHFCSSTTNPHTSLHRSERISPVPEKGTQESIPIPPEYGVPYGVVDGGDQPGACSDTASAEYLRGFRTHAVEHCSSLLGDSMHCFHGTINGQDSDLFCIARGVVLDEKAKRFSLGCDTGTSKESPRGVFNSDEMQRQSGPGAVFDSYFDNLWKPEDLLSPPLQVENSQAEQSNYTILIKREGTASFWDSLMEIMSMTLSMDILRMSSDIRLGDPSIKIPADLPRTQVIILDDLPEGQLCGLWAFFAGSAPIRFKDVLDDKTKADALLSAHTAIVPLPGSSNPLSQIDQHDAPDCRYSGLARTFARRVSRKYGVLYPQGGNADPKVVVRVTLVAGTDTRRIRDADHLLQALRRASPNVIAQEVDFAAISMKEQLQIAQSTDVLVGAHGDGREGEGAVVEVHPAGPPPTHHQARYRSLAAMLGRKYLLAEAAVAASGQAGIWDMDMKQGDGGDKSTTVESELARRNTELLSARTNWWIKLVGQSRR